MHNEQQRTELRNRFVSTTSHLNRLMCRDLLDFLEGLDLSDLQLRMLMLLDESEPLRISDVTDHLGCTPSHTTNMMDSLIGKNMVVRAPDPHDRRALLCDILPEGRKVLDRLEQIAHKRTLAITETWSLELFESVIAAMKTADDGRR